MKIFKMKRFFIFTSIMVLVWQAGWSQKAGAIAVQARDFYYQNFGTEKHPSTLYSWKTNYAVNFKEGGYILLQKIKDNVQVTAVIPEGQFGLQNNRLLDDKEVVQIQQLTSLPPLDTGRLNTVRNPLDDVPNFLTDEWGSVNCIDDQNNIVNVTNYYTPGHCSAGCVAISTSQILHYYEWPRIGVGNNTYSDNYNGSLVRHSAFFDERPYDWDLMLDQYMYVHSTDAQREAVGKLVYDVAVAVEMDFEPTGSTSNVNKVPFILENFFRYVGHYEDISWSQFWSRMYRNMQERVPVSVAIENSAGDGHAIVVSGYKEMNGLPYYYINWGWYNQGTPNNGWYNMQGWNNSTPGYNTVLGALFDVIPEPEITSITPTGTGNDFLIHWETAQNVNYEEFTLQRKIDNGSWQTVATGITGQDYVYQNPTGNVYQFRVKGKTHGRYYTASYSERIPYAPQGWFNGYGSFEGQQYAYARQTANYDLIFNHDYTFETWLRLKPGNQDGDVIFDRQYIFALEIEDVTANDYSVVFKSPASQDALHSGNSGQKLQIGQWYHIAVSNQGDTAKLFINGEERDSNNQNHFHLNSSNAAINIGERYHGSYSGFIKADFDQIRWSDTARYVSNFTPDRNVFFPVDSHTKAYFRFENVHRNRLKDEAFKTSVRVKNAPGYVQWGFDYDPNGSNIIDEDDFSQNILVYPVPATGYFDIKSLSDKYNLEDFDIKLFDESGRRIENLKMVSGSIIYRIDISHLRKGVYVLILKNRVFKASTKIIVK